MTKHATFTYASDSFPEFLVIIVLPPLLTRPSPFIVFHSNFKGCIVTNFYDLVEQPKYTDLHRRKPNNPVLFKNALLVD